VLAADVIGFFGVRPACWKQPVSDFLQHGSLR
jgi:hypothetical protein